MLNLIRLEQNQVFGLDFSLETLRVNPNRVFLDRLAARRKLNCTYFVAARRKPSDIGVDNPAENRAACAAPLTKTHP